MNAGLQRDWDSAWAPRNARKEIEDLPRSEHYQLVLDEFSKLKKGDLVLDAGCGFGRWVYLAETMGLEAFGIDISASALRVAKKYLGSNGIANEFITTDIRRIPISLSRLNYVLSFGAVEHFPDTSTAIAEFYRVLVKGGKCFVSTPNTNSFHGFIGNSLRKTLRRKDLGYFGFEDSYTPTQLARMMKGVGFKQLKYEVLSTGLLFGGFYKFIPPWEIGS